MMSRLNRQWFQLSSNRFITLFFRRSRRPTGVDGLLERGHNPPLVLRSGGEGICSEGDRAPAPSVPRRIARRAVRVSLGDLVVFTATALRRR